MRIADSPPIARHFRWNANVKDLLDVPKQIEIVIANKIDRSQHEVTPAPTRLNLQED